MKNEKELQEQYLTPVLKEFAVEIHGVIADSGGGAGGNSGGPDPWS